MSSDDSNCCLFELIDNENNKNDTKIKSDVDSQCVTSIFLRVNKSTSVIYMGRECNSSRGAFKTTRCFHIVDVLSSLH